MLNCYSISNCFHLDVLICWGHCSLMCFLSKLRSKSMGEVLIFAIYQISKLGRASLIEKFFKTVLREWTLKLLTGHALLLEFPFGWEIKALCTFFETFSYFCFVVLSNFVWFSCWRIITINRIALNHYLHRYRHSKLCNNLFI